MNKQIPGDLVACVRKSITTTSVPTTTIRVSLEIHDLLKRVAELEKCSLFVTTELALDHFVSTWESMAQTKLGKKKEPAGGLEMLRHLKG